MDNPGRMKRGWRIARLAWGVALLATGIVLAAVNVPAHPVYGVWLQVAVIVLGLFSLYKAARGR